MNDSTDGDDNGGPEVRAVRNRGLGEFGCSHYRRRVKLVTPCCGEIFWCRHCHNEAKHDNEKDVKLRHELDRSLVTEVVCALCSLRQPVGDHCCRCGVAFGAYACTLCPFYDDDVSKQAFHCADCGICRVGGRENFFHCDTCGSCYSTKLRGRHVCVERAMHQNCPVCFEYLFESVQPTAVLPCGHTIHSSCLKELERSDSVSVCACCPICKRSLQDNSATWRYLDSMAASHPLPEEYVGWQAEIFCNDCLSTCTVQYNLVGLKCGGCGSYNTRRLALVPAVTRRSGGQNQQEDSQGSMSQSNGTEIVRRSRDQAMHLEERWSSEEDRQLEAYRGSPEGSD
ncbi:hypothetical protein ACKKBG_A00510 [Auxenochlorella protothecoides x Auxenochlorella symbiontica]